MALPYWDSLARFAKDHGVRLAVEMCGSQLVYNVSTMKRLADATDPTVVGANLDPSHLMWMGADIPSVIRSLGRSIFHVHAKDVRINRHNAAHNGVLDTVDVTDPHARAWYYVTLGLGHLRRHTEHRARGRVGQRCRRCSEGHSPTAASDSRTRTRLATRTDLSGAALPVKRSGYRERVEVTAPRR
nr:MULTISPECIES: TIM barrel protein [Rhodococcus]